MISDSLISIVIPCYNDAQYIEQSVQSALDQTYPFKEVIVVDDGSNLETKAVLKKLEPKITKLITQENQGQSRARNVGIQFAKGEYIMVLDSDDYLEPTFCEVAFEVFKIQKSIKIVTCQAYLIIPNENKILYTPNGGNIQSFLFSNAALGSSMFQKKDWTKSHGYDELMRKGFEDWEFFIRILKDGGKAFVIQKPLYNYRKRANTTTSKANKKRYELIEYILLKHMDLYQYHFEDVIGFYTKQLQKKDTEINRLYQKIDFKLGSFILKPFRLIKNSFK